eukprot:5824041-Amphidinium_carterae.1
MEDVAMRHEQQFLQKSAWTHTHTHTRACALRRVDCVRVHPSVSAIVRKESTQGQPKRSYRMT